MDGKTLRGSKTSPDGKGALHLVSAYATQAGLVLAQRAVDGKSNEITAIPELLDMLTLKGAIVSIDAMGAQKEIAGRIVDKGAHYVLALKGNQAGLHADAALFFADPVLAASCARVQDTDAGHGPAHRQEDRPRKPRNPLLHHLPRTRSQGHSRRNPRPLGRREPSLDAGRDLRRRPPPNPKRRLGAELRGHPTRRIEHPRRRQNPRFTAPKPPQGLHRPRVPDKAVRRLTIEDFTLIRRPGESGEGFHAAMSLVR